MDPFILTYEVDEHINETREYFLRRDPEGLRIAIRTIPNIPPLQVKADYAADADSCWTPMNKWNKATLKNVEKIRRHIARETGLSIAAFQTFLPQHYDRYATIMYRPAFRVMCKHGKPYCIRPSHLVIRTPDGRTPQELLADQRRSLAPTKVD